jgi:hypothetical protein
VVLSTEERQVLKGWARRRETAEALALRSKIVAVATEPVTSSLAARRGQLNAVPVA